MLNLARTGTSAVLGVASGALDSGLVTPLNLGGTVISWATIAEALGLVGGGVLQLAMPDTMPSVGDGLVDGALALLAARGTKYAVVKLRPAAGSYFGAQRVGALSGNGFGALSGAPLYSRGQVGIQSRVPKQTIT